MGLVNKVVPLSCLEEETLVWCREILKNSPTALRMCKAALNAAEGWSSWVAGVGWKCNPAILPDSRGQ